MKKLLSALVAVAFALTAVAQEKGADKAVVPATPPAEKAAPAAPAEKAAPAKKESKKKKKTEKKGGADKAVVPSN
jgi:Ni/Co efflux regulator RcnB